MRRFTSRALLPVLLAAAAGLASTAAGAQVGGASARVQVVGARPTSPTGLALARRAAARAPAGDERAVRVSLVETPRSRARGARRGALIGAAVGGVAGLLITNDFMDEPLVNMAGGAIAGGLIGLVLGAAVGAPASQR